MADDRQSEPRPEELPNHERLDSWKGIASYLNRAVRTVQLWEKEEGLPVHRHLHKKQGSVYAYRSELDAWWSQHRLRLNAAPSSGGRLLGRRLWAVAGIAFAFVPVAAILVFVARPSPDPHNPKSPSRPVMAVLFFENVAREPSLDWLSTGLAQMVVTNLSQSGELEVIGPERIYGRGLENEPSRELMQRVAEQTGASLVIAGSFMKAGAIVRIDVRVHEPASGRVLASEKVEGAGESTLFFMVDELTRRIKVALDVPVPADSFQERELKELTTTSLEAYHYYVEGLRLHLASKPKEALVLFEKAAEVDPGFAMATFRVGNMYAGSGRLEDAEPYFLRALANLDRVSPRERYYMEAMYHSWHGQASYGRVVETLKKALELFPDDDAIRFNLAQHYGELERFPEAIELLEGLRARARSHVFIENEYMFDQVAVGEFEKPRRALEDYIRSASDDAERARAFISLAKNYLYWGKYAETMGALRQAESIRGDVDPGSSVGVRWLLGVSTEDFPLAEKASDELSAASDPYLRWLGLSRRAVSELYHGRSRESLTLIDKAAGSHPDGGLLRARVHPLAAHVLLERGDPEGALERARTAQVEGKGDITEWEGAFFAAMAQARLGRLEEAEKIADVFRRIAESLPTEKEKRRYRHLLGELALARGDSDRAIQELTEAESMLPARGYVWFPRGVPEHVPIWYSLARANLAAGEDEEASRWFRRIIESPAERTDWPIFYVRSSYFLGKIHESRGETENALKSYRRFLDFWEDGDLDREQIEEVEKKLRLLDPQLAQADRHHDSG